MKTSIIHKNFSNKQIITTFCLKNILFPQQQGLI